MLQHDPSQSLSSPAVLWTIGGLGIALLATVTRELLKIPAQLRVLMATAFVDMVGVFFVVPLVPFYCKRFAENGVTLFGNPLLAATIIGIVSSTFTVAQSVSAPMWGRFSDRFGRRPALLIALTGSAAGFTIFGFADSLWLLLLSRVVQGAGGGTVGVIQSYVADSVAPEERARALGWLSAATNLGVAIGPFLGGYAVALGDVDFLPGPGKWTLGTSAPGLAAAALCLLNMAFALRHLPESHQRPDAGAPRRSSWPAALATLTHPGRPVSRLLWIYAVTIGASQGVMPMMPLLMNEAFGANEKEVGTVYAYIGIVSVFARMLLLGRLLDRFGEARLSRIGMATLATGLCLLPFAHTILQLAVIVPLMPMGMALTFPCVSALLSRVAPADQRGMYLGLQQTYGGFSRAVMPNVFARLFDHVGHAVPFAAAAATVLVTMPLGFGLHRFSKQTKTVVAVSTPGR